MKYILKLVMEGNFPGSPDVQSCEISELEYETFVDVWIREEREEENEYENRTDV